MASPVDPETSASPEEPTMQPLMLAAPLPPVSGAGDLELRLLQAVSEYAGHGLVRSYSYVKHSSRVLGFVASSTETVVTKAGLVALVKFFYEQYLRFGYPAVRYVDEAVGRCVVGAFVRVLLAVEYQQSEGSVALITANGESLQLTYYERLQALLYGRVPRLQGLIMEMYACAEKARNAPPVVTFNPEEYVLKDEVERLQKDSSSALKQKEQELATFKKQLQAAELAREQLELAMKDVEAAEKAKNLKLQAEKEKEIASLSEQVQAAAHAREQLKEQLESAQEQRERELDTLMTQKQQELAMLKKQVEEAERGREQLRANLREALDLKDNEKREALTVKEEEVATLKKEVEAAKLAREKLEQELKRGIDSAEQARKEVELDLKSKLEAAELERKKVEEELKSEIEAAELARKKIEEELKSEVEAVTLAQKKAEEELKSEVKAAEVARKMAEEKLKSEVEAAELARKKAEEELEATRIRMESEHSKRVKELENELAAAKHVVSEQRADSLRQQRTSFNANLVKDYVQHAKGDERARSASDNQREDEELTSSARSSSTSQSSATSPRSEELKKAKIEKEKLNQRMRRVLGSRF